VGRAFGIANTLNTFAIDPNLQVSYAQNWNASIQRDLPMSLTVNATYLGAKGSNLMQAFVPLFLTNGWGRLIAVSSPFASHPQAPR